VHFNFPDNAIWMYLLKLGTTFMVGSVIFLFRERVPDSGWLALACAVVFVASLWLPGAFPAIALTPSDLLAPLVAYPLLWLGSHLPFQRVGARNDYSYGVYIYAFPVTVLLLIWHAQRLGELTFVVLCVAGTIPFAVGSWWFIEKRALKHKKLDPKLIMSWIVGPKPVESSAPREPTENGVPAASVVPTHSELD
jgi:peptidoglycan/LPS O-acetylase OafA/YrhL